MVKWLGHKAHCATCIYHQVTECRFRYTVMWYLSAQGRILPSYLIFLTMVLIEKTQWHCDIVAVLLPVCMVATAVMSKYCGRVLDYDLNDDPLLHEWTLIFSFIRFPLNFWLLIFIETWTSHFWGNGGGGVTINLIKSLHQRNENLHS
jgi:hypothetical protein